MSGAPATAVPRSAGETRGEAQARVATALAAAGVPQPRREARLLLALALESGIESVIGYPELELDAAQTGRLEAALKRRVAREPLSRIQGQREFWGLRFALTPATLDPRPDSETLVEAVLEARPETNAPLSLLDLGTGSGCLLLSLLTERPHAEGLGVDRSPMAIETAVSNAESLGLTTRTRFVAGDWAACLRGGWDIVVCNPPYVAEADVLRLEPEVALYDPRAALTAGMDGLDAYRALLPDLPKLLRTGGLAVLEIGAGQGDSVADLAGAVGLRTRFRRCDLSGIERCLGLEARA